MSKATLLGKKSLTMAKTLHDYERQCCKLCGRLLIDKPGKILAKFQEAAEMAVDLLSGKSFSSLPVQFSVLPERRGSQAVEYWYLDDEYTEMKEREIRDAKRARFEPDLISAPSTPQEEDNIPDIEPPVFTLEATEMELSEEDRNALAAVFAAGGKGFQSTPQRLGAGVGVTVGLVSGDAAFEQMTESEQEAAKEAFDETLEENVAFSMEIQVGFGVLFFSQISFQRNCEVN